MRDRLDELLARGRLSGAERERILAAALAAGAPQPWWRRRAAAWLLPAFATIALLFFVVPRRPHEHFRARGGGAATTPLLLVGCEDGQAARCRQGQKLLFTVEGASEAGFMGAYAEPDAASGERVWYFPANDESALEVRAAAEPQTLAKAVRIGPQQPAGHYVIHLVLSRRPLTRQDVLQAKGADVLATNRVPLDVTP